MDRHWAGLLWCKASLEVVTELGRTALDSWYVPVTRFLVFDVYSTDGVTTGARRMMTSKDE